MMRGLIVSSIAWFVKLSAPLIHVFRWPSIYLINHFWLATDSFQTVTHSISKAMDNDVFSEVRIMPFVKCIGYWADITAGIVSVSREGKAWWRICLDAACCPKRCTYKQQLSLTVFGLPWPPLVTVWKLSVANQKWLTRYVNGQRGLWVKNTDKGAKWAWSSAL